MSTPDPIRMRWADSDSAEPLARLMRSAVAEAERPTLSPAQLSRVRARLLQTLWSPPPHSSWWTWSLGQILATAAGGAVFGLLLGLGGYHALLHSGARHLAESPPIAAGPGPGPAPTPLPPVSQPQFVMMGPGNLILPSADAPAQVLAGTLLVKTADARAVISAPESEIRVAGHSVAEIEVSGQSVVVATHRGQALVSWAQDAQPVPVLTGMAADKKETFRIPPERWKQIEP